MASGNAQLSGGDMAAFPYLESFINRKEIEYVELPMCRRRTAGQIPFPKGFSCSRLTAQKLMPAADLCVVCVVLVFY